MLKANRVWNMALLQAAGDPFDIAAATPIRVFSSRQIRRTLRSVHTRADPFLFVDGQWLYLFFEVQRVGEPGYIEACRTRDLVSFESVGCVLAPEFHVSYPHVFGHDNSIFMVPETARANEVALYRFDVFPNKLTKLRTLLSGRYSDCTLFKHHDTWWLFACSSAGLELFYADDLLSKFYRHPAGIITADPAFYRCGGPVLTIGGDLFRPAQDGTINYGNNLSVMRIVELTRTEYRESVERRNLFDREATWRSLGAHHISIASFEGRTIIAVDGQQADHWINRPISLLMKCASCIRHLKS